MRVKRILPMILGAFLVVIICRDENGERSYSKGDTMNKAHTNQLIEEQSPYLLQHAHNPVAWYPWGQEAFEKASREDKPIFLSIGYSTCHWCHVMEHESFEDEETARLMNDTFVSIKVDREERPDIDNVYMTVCQMLTGKGGWPLTIVMTPDKKPFFAGTYLPRESRLGRLGLRELTEQIDHLWRNDRNKVLDSATQIIATLENVAKQSDAGGELDSQVFDKAFQELSATYDPKHGGFGEAPKFPTPHRLIFLLRYWEKTKNAKALEMAETTLERMRNGGLFDQIGFGFHRYSTDQEWLVPHFEKMLYDQALLCSAYLEGYEATGNRKLAETAEEILTYVSRDMTSPSGGFYSAEDADSDGEEGKFYVWSTEELRKLLGAKDADKLIDICGLTEEGNFTEEATGHKTGRNILRLNQPNVRIPEQIRQKLFEERKKRVFPFKDTKILTDWNALMIAAFAKAGRTLKKGEYTSKAVDAATFVIKNLKNKKTGELFHRHKNGDSAIKGHLDDYAFMIQACLELYETLFEVKWLREALNLTKTTLERFGDNESGAFFMTADNSEKLLIRPTEAYDGAVPSGNSAMLLNLLKLSRLTGNPDYEQLAAKLENAFSKLVKHSPSNFSWFLCGALFAAGPTDEIVISGGKDDAIELFDAVRSVYSPNKVVVWRPPGKKPSICAMSPFVKSQTMIDDKPTAYVCRNFSCGTPITEPKELKKKLTD